MNALLQTQLVNNPREIPNPAHYPIAPDATAWDVGAYKGSWSKNFRSVSSGDIHLFECHPAHFAQLVVNMADITAVHLHERGISARTHEGALSDEGDGSTLYESKTDCKYAVRIIGVEEAARKYGIPVVMKINVEGAEYDILETMLAHGLVQPVGLFLIQFHKVVPRFEERRAEIQNRLSATHVCLVDRPFVWEAWGRKP